MTCHPQSALLLIMIALQGSCTFGFQSVDEASLLSNGEFQRWRQGQPVGWDVSVGATGNGGEPSNLTQADGPSLQLQGNSRTGVWNLVSQTVALEPNTAYFLDATASAGELKRESNQFDNCYVGIFLKTPQGKRIDQFLANVTTSEYRQYLVPFKTTANTRQGQVSIFLSKTGSLNVGKVALRKVTLSNSFDVLVADMGRHYSRFGRLGLDWNELASRYRERGRAAKTPAELEDVLAEMFGGTAGHACLDCANGKPGMSPSPNLHPILILALSIEI